MSTEMTVAFIVLSVWSAVFTAAYIGERYRNRKLRNALKKKRSRYAAGHYQQIHMKPLHALAVRNERRFATE